MTRLRARLRAFTRHVAWAVTAAVLAVADRVERAKGATA